MHIPITTNERTRFVVDGEMLPMQPGDCWYPNFGLTHSARNDGATEEGLPELFLRVADLLALSLDAGDLQRIPRTLCLQHVEKSPAPNSSVTTSMSITGDNENV